MRKRDAKHHACIIEIEDKQKRMQNEMRKDSQDVEKQLKIIQVKMITPAPAAETEEKAEEKKSQKKTDRPKESPDASRDEVSVNFKNQLNDKLSNIQNSLQGFVTEAEFNRFKTESRENFEELEKKQDKFYNEYEEEIKKIYDMFINKDIEMNRMGETISSTSEVIKENSAQAERKHNITIARIDELKKGLQNLREDVEFYQSLNAESKEKKPQETEKGGERELTIQKEKVVDGKAVEDLKRHFNNKMHDQRAYLVGLVRDLDKRQNAASNVHQEIANIWDKLNELNVFMNKKAESDDTKKNLAYLEKKINRLGALIMKDENNTEDARIARTNWVCLSCDKNLLGYQGKIGKHVVWDQMPLKGVVKTTIEKKGLPSLKSK